MTLAVTVAWTALNVALHVTIGVTLALALVEPWLRARGLLRALLILPWAVPNYITCLIWQGMFQRQYGAVNALLEDFAAGRLSDGRALDLRPAAVDELLASRGAEPFGAEAWFALDRAEIGAGEAQGRPRVKTVRWDDLLRRLLPD